MQAHAPGPIAAKDTRGGYCGSLTDAFAGIQQRPPSRSTVYWPGPNPGMAATKRAWSSAPSPAVAERNAIELRELRVVWVGTTIVASRPNVLALRRDVVM